MSRLTSPVPKFWRKVQWYAGTIAAILGAVIGIYAAQPLPNADILLWLQIAVGVSLAIVGTAQFTKQDKPEP